jgi:hypothetical protein
MTDNLTNNLNQYLELKNQKVLNLFWIGYTIYVVSYSFPASSKLGYFISQGLQIIGFLIFVIASINIIQWKFSNNYLRIVFSVYCLWSFITLARGFKFEYDFIKSLFLSAWFGIFIYFAPFILLFPKDIKYLKKIFSTIFVLSIFYFLFDLFFRRVLMWGIGGNRFSTGVIETFCHFLSIPSGFVLLTYIYHSNKRNLIALAAMVLTFLLAAIRARRGLMFMSMTILLASYIIYYFTNRGAMLRIILSIFMVIFLVIYGREVYFSHRSGMFGLITGRIDEDTRTGVVNNFYGSMDTKSWIFGRGINGQYYCPGIDETVGNVTIYRDVIETGYLQVILKGGLLSLCLFLMMAIPAVFKGLFHSNNILTKACAIWILLFILYLYPTTINGFTVNYLLIWVAIGICYDSDIREMTNEKIKAELA